jgi:Flp pilus assembly protein TadG
LSIGPRDSRRASDERGQATVELALSLPLVALLLATVVDVAMVAADQARLLHAAREAARTAVVDDDAAEIRAAAENSGLKDVELVVTPKPEMRRQGDPLTVRLSYKPPARTPIVGILFQRITLRAEATMRIEQP